jgi:hypothetical protein
MITMNSGETKCSLKTPQVPRHPGKTPTVLPAMPMKELTANALELWQGGYDHRRRHVHVPNGHPLHVMTALRTRFL